MSLHLNINGDDRLSVKDPLTPLVDVLRDEFFLTGAKVVCREGFCGACTVLLDNVRTRICLFAVSRAVGQEITIIEENWEWVEPPKESGQW